MGSAPQARNSPAEFPLANPMVGYGAARLTHPIFAAKRRSE